MKYLCFLFIFLIAGCSFLPDEMKTQNRGLLGTAPADASDVMYPEWGNEGGMAEKTSSPLSGAYEQGLTRQTPSQASKKSHGSDYASLIRYLRRNQIPYEVIHGDYPMIRVKQTVQFGFNSATLSASSKQWLAKIRNYMVTAPQRVELVIDGHTDDSGDAAYNDYLSKERANAVKQYLAHERVMVDSIYTRGYGNVIPVCSNRTSKGQACNRRVELYFILSS